jgi:hypothetical protein
MPNLSDRIREELKAETGPCPGCGRPRLTIAAVAGALDQPASSVGNFLKGGKPSVALLDSADAWLQGKAAAVVEPILAGLEAAGMVVGGDEDVVQPS